jgi:hypothetical protein
MLASALVIADAQCRPNRGASLHLRLAERGDPLGDQVGDLLDLLVDAVAKLEMLEEGQAASLLVRGTSWPKASGQRACSRTPTCSRAHSGKSRRLEYTASSPLPPTLRPLNAAALPARGAVP